MVVLRPIRNMVKLFAAEETTLMQDLMEVNRMCEQIMMEESMGEDTATEHNINTIRKEVRENINLQEWEQEDQFCGAFYALHFTLAEENEEKMFLL